MATPTKHLVCREVILGSLPPKHVEARPGEGGEVRMGNIFVMYSGVRTHSRKVF